MKKHLFSVLLLIITSTVFAQAPASNPFFKKADETKQTLEQEEVKESKSIKKESGFYRKLANFQKRFNAELSELVLDYQENKNFKLLFYILIFALAYGTTHALTPGHGKNIIAGWIVASNKKLYKITITALLGMIIHVFTAYLMIYAIWFIIKGRISTSSEIFIKYFSYFAAFVIVLISLKMFVQMIMRIIKKSKADKTKSKLIEKLNHSHEDDLKNIKEDTSWKECFFISLSMGLVPCPVASILTVFMLTKGLYFLSFVLILFFAVGMAITLIVYSLVLWFGRNILGNITDSKFSKITEPIFSSLGILLLLFSAFTIVAPYL